MQKPLIHFAPEKNWMNDPNGTIYLNGIFHLFYQYNPEGCDWGNIRWAYATSVDLINWTRKGIRLSPDKNNGERYCFSGCSVKTPKELKCFYTSIGFENDAITSHAKQIICDTDENFDVIRRNGHVVDVSIHPFSVTDWRDPFVFYFDKQAYMVLAGVACERSNILLYRAKDKELNHWQYVSSIFSVDANEDLLECPNVAVFGNKIVLLYSCIRESIVRYVCGDFDGCHFTVKEKGCVDYGKNCFYATNLAYDYDGKYYLFGWQRESLSGIPSVDGTYSGCLAIPRVLQLNGYTLQFYFIPNLWELNKQELKVDRKDLIRIKSSAEQTLLSFTVNGNAELEILQNKKEKVNLRFENKKLCIMRISDFKKAEYPILMADIQEENNKIQIISDGTISEIFVNQHTVISFRFYRIQPIENVFVLKCGDIINIRAIELNKADIH